MRPATSATALSSVLVLAATLPSQSGLWGQLQFPTSPTPRYACAMAYDSVRDRLVLLSGTSTGFNSIQETWENDGSQWLLRGNFGPATSPNSAASVQAVYDVARQRTVAVRSDSGGNTTQTWEWNGSAWVNRVSAQTPPGRFDFALAYDSVRGVTVLFGGSSGALGAMADTWEWNGTNWTQRSSGGPQGRMQHAMAFDAARGVTVLFGGHRDISSYTAQFGDTWEWNGSYWVEAFGVAAPPARSRACMVWDAARQRTVLWGGRMVYGGSTEFADTWEWNGSQWTNQQASGPVGQMVAMAFDSSRQRAVAFGGVTVNSTALNATWAYAAPSGPLASIAPYGAGCAGPNGVPLLAVVSGVPRLGSTLNLRLTNLPTGPVNIPLGWIGFDNTQWNGLSLPLALDPAGFPGCVALLAPQQAFSFQNVAGVANWTIAIPFLPAFTGLPFFVQGGVFVPGFNPGGIVFSRGLAGIVGR